MISAELKVNNEVVGRFEAKRTFYHAEDGRPLYQAVVTEILPGETRGRSRLVAHDPDDGAWSLVRKCLEDEP